MSNPYGVPPSSTPSPYGAPEYGAPPYAMNPVGLPGDRPPHRVRPLLFSCLAIALVVIGMAVALMVWVGHELGPWFGDSSNVVVYESPDYTPPPRP